MALHLTSSSLCAFNELSSSGVKCVTHRYIGILVCMIHTCVATDIDILPGTVHMNVHIEKITLMMVSMLSLNNHSHPYYPSSKQNELSKQLLSATPERL
jgi:hypothetical protein